MIAEGQEFLRSKQGISNSYNKGDRINALDWSDRDRPLAREALSYYRGLIHLRQSPEGAAFRVAERPPDHYYRWIEPPNPQALGYIVNAARIHKGAGFVVLLNGSGQAIPFSVSFPDGQWLLIGDGQHINRKGIPGRNVVSGPVTTRINVPGVTAVIFMNSSS